MSQPYGLDFLVGFATYLRGRGFTISPDQTIGFVEGVSLLGARDPEAVKRVALAMFSVPHERFEAFDLLFRAYFLGEALQFEQAGEDRDDSLEVREDAGLQPVEIEEKGEAVSGLEATEIEILSHRVLDAGGENEALNRFRRLAPRMLPARKTGRYVRSRRGPGIDMRRAVREASRLDGDLARIPMRRRKIRQRRIVLLIDVSGSMKEQSESSLRFAHALSRASERFEAFSLGTRLTRITSALDHRDRELALRHASRLIADLDGGTRIGESLPDATFAAVVRELCTRCGCRCDFRRARKRIARSNGRRDSQDIARGLETAVADTPVVNRGVQSINFRSFAIATPYRQI